MCWVGDDGNDNEGGSVCIWGGGLLEMNGECMIMKMDDDQVVGGGGAGHGHGDERTHGDGRTASVEVDHFDQLPLFIDWSVIIFHHYFHLLIIISLGPLPEGTGRTHRSMFSHPPSMQKQQQQKQKQLKLSTIFVCLAE
uniref:Uncharacterized protein n=1 Tax=Globodera rostochiensis TaxID=31243 RepID=A0A914HWB7_GLORO